jgi:methyl-accepting chemotaxis protein
VAEQKRQHDASIRSIVETHTRVANGDLEARVPLTQDNVLWQISGSLNKLLARLQRLSQDTAKVQQMQIALKEAHKEIARLKRIVSTIEEPH